tara:strand:+ start:1234 stop:1407 length:174 start_codon:yes stop_codon:yes gene_type:complete
MSGTHIALAISKRRVKELEEELDNMWRVLENLNLKATIQTYMREDMDISEAIDEVTA